MRLTKTNVERITAPESGYAIHWDDTLKGFGVRVTASGIKSYVVQRRINGRERRVTLGRHGPSFPAEKARRNATVMLGEIADGKDPVAERQRAKAESVTLRDAFDAYLLARPLKPLTVDDMERAMGGFKDWMKKPITRITRDMVSTRHRALGQKSEARANIAMRYLRAVLNFAAEEYSDPEGKPILTDNPVRKLSAQKTWYRIDRRQTVIRSHQIKPWVVAVQALAETPEREVGEGRHKPKVRYGEVFSDYLMFLLLTGLRRTEALELTWKDVDLTGRTITVRDPKNRQPHTLPLSDYLCALLERRQESSGDLVFSHKDGVPLSNFRRIQARVADASGVTFTLHDLRRTFATIAESLDIPAYALKRLLNHKTTADVTAGYIVTDVERLRAPMQKITDYVLKAADLKPSAEVVQLRREHG